MAEDVRQFRITNCHYGEQCSSDWEELKTVCSSGSRYCQRCETEIHWCDTIEDLVHHASLENAVAFARKPVARVSGVTSVH